MKKNTILLRYLMKKKCILFSKNGFTTKWGERFLFETDIRPAFLTQNDAKNVSRLIYPLIRESTKSFDFFIGVPETGSLMAFFLNELHADAQKKNIPVNMLRAKPKPYQGMTKYSVQPLSRKARVVLIEDDVVTGNTLCTYVKILFSLDMKHVQVVSVIDRQQKDASGRTVGGRIKKDFGYTYRTLITLEDIKDAVPVSVYVR